MPAGTLEPVGVDGILADPPMLGVVPPYSRKKALAFSVVIYGGLVAGVAGLTFATPVLTPRPRTVAVALDSFDAVPAPPPPPPGFAKQASPTTKDSAHSGDSTPTEPPNETRPTQESILALAPSQAGGRPSGGVVGGVPGGVSGGVIHGQVGGTLGGQVGGVVSPRFDAAYLNNPEPEYPAISKRLGEEGRVLLRVLVTIEGLADQIEVRQTSGHSRLDQAALTTVRRWRFTPARRGEERIAAWVLVPLSFQLEA